ncbi:TIGR03619 family F420-dependent LLM class oxidoreductase [Kutzneria sp. 744]|uniref:TIGR03619 family F420-dependent LLM class oxidoreductase n=1 Tax=Kutzneria sp. (strain 744) TaxID=345341 RepID=UPI0003EEB953|nr:TIGR03619 family F420-dependent LLM class oxidoreductase [Kutzneria sp. 744]EWM19396.1 F420-dependent oxidoreductase [Kutzneria sp. 744]
MQLGIAVFAGVEGQAPAELGRAVEERGFESLFYAEHTHIPVASRRDDDRPPRDYASSYDPFLALAAAAAVTTTLRLGTAVCLVPQRDPIITAKEVASLDRMSGGRFEFGVGAGWNRAELANHGTDPRRRMAVLADRVQAMRAIWTSEEAEHHGPHADFEPLWSWSKPVQRPHPPVLVGGNGPGVEDRVLAFGDGWLPQCGHLASVRELTDRIASLRHRAGKRVPVTLFGAIPSMLGAFAEAGVDRCLFTLQSGPGDLDELDRWAELIGPRSAGRSFD